MIYVSSFSKPSLKSIRTRFRLNKGLYIKVYIGLFDIISSDFKYCLKHSEKRTGGIISSYFRWDSVLNMTYVTRVYC